MSKKIIDITGLKRFSDNIKIYIENLVTNKQNTTVNIIYSDLKQLRDENKLIPGQKYRITDYITCTSQSGTKSAGHQFDIIVEALNENTLSEEVKACLHEGDTYFSEHNANLEAWQLWYDIDNDTNKYAWADKTNGKGVIYRMIDDKNNDCPYDFKNILLYTDKYTSDNTSDNYYYTFSYVVDDVLYDGTVNSQVKYCYGNSMKTVLNNGKQSININIFKNTYFTDSCHSNTFGNNCKSNTFGYGCKSNTFGDECWENTFGHECYSNTFGYNCYKNTFRSRCHYNTFGYSCYLNTFGGSCYKNTFGNECSSNTFGDDCRSNTFGDGCNSNAFVGYCYYNTFGNYCSSNALEDECYYNTFGNRCSYNTFGFMCKYNTFINDCRSNAFGGSCCYNTFGTDCNYIGFYDGYDYNYSGSTIKYNNNCLNFITSVYIGNNCNKLLFYTDNNINYDNKIQNLTVVKGNFKPTDKDSNDKEIPVMIKLDVINNDYELKIAKNSSGDIKIYCEADLIQ